MKKVYPLHQSRLFKITSKKKLSLILGTDLSILKALSDGHSFKAYVNTSGRPIQYPIGDLISLHKKLGDLFSCIEVPAFLTSRRGSSYVKNADTHTGNISVIKTDISKFYPNVGFGLILRMFIDDFKCAPDVAWILARLCSYNGAHLPTGSKISGYVAYLANREMFNEIEQLAIENECVMTCYVDDIIISGKRANKRLLTKVRRIVLRHGLVTKSEKSKCYAPSMTKKITGCIVKGNQLLLPNSRHRKITSIRRQLQNEADPVTRELLERSLAGRLAEANQILKKITPPLTT